MRRPLWSLVGEYQESEWALMSPAIMELVRFVMKWNVFVMSESSVGWFGSVESLGGM